MAGAMYLNFKMICFFTSSFIAAKVKARQSTRTGTTSRTQPGPIKRARSREDDDAQSLDKDRLDLAGDVGKFVTGAGLSKSISTASPS